MRLASVTSWSAVGAEPCRSRAGRAAASRARARRSGRASGPSPPRRGRAGRERRLVLEPFDELDAVVDQVGVELLDLLLGEVDFLGHDLVVGEEPGPGLRDELWSSSISGRRCRPGALTRLSRYPCNVVGTKEPARSPRPRLSRTGRGFYNDCGKIGYEFSGGRRDRANCLTPAVADRPLPGLGDAQDEARRGIGGAVRAVVDLQRDARAVGEADAEDALGPALGDRPRQRPRRACRRRRARRSAAGGQSSPARRRPRPRAPARTRPPRTRAISMRRARRSARRSRRRPCRGPRGPPPRRQARGHSAAPGAPAGDSPPTTSPAGARGRETPRACPSSCGGAWSRARPHESPRSRRRRGRGALGRRRAAPAAPRARRTRSRARRRAVRTGRAEAPGAASPRSGRS